MKKRVFQFLTIGAFCLSFTMVGVQSLSAEDCVRKFTHKEDWARKFMSGNCRKKDGSSCKQKTQGCPPKISIAGVKIGG
jgi:hypothetical protein